MKEKIFINLKEVSILDHFSSDHIKYWDYSEFVKRSGTKKILVNLQEVVSDDYYLLEFIVTRKKIYYCDIKSIYELSVKDFEDLMEANKYIKYDLSNMN